MNIFIKVWHSRADLLHIVTHVCKQRGLHANIGTAVDEPVLGAFDLWIRKVYECNLRVLFGTDNI